MDTKKTTPNKKKNKTIITKKDNSKENVAKICKTTARLNMREQPGMDKKIITVIPQGVQVIYYGYHVNEWYYVKYNNQVGFCNSRWLQ